MEDRIHKLEERVAQLQAELADLVKKDRAKDKRIDELEKELLKLGQEIADLYDRDTLSFV